MHDCCYSKPKCCDICDKVTSPKHPPNSALSSGQKHIMLDSRGNRLAFRKLYCSCYATGIHRLLMICLPRVSAWKLNNRQKPEASRLGITLSVKGFLQSDQSQDRINTKCGVILALLILHMCRMVILWVHWDYRHIQDKYMMNKLHTSV